MDIDEWNKLGLLFKAFAHNDEKAMQQMVATSKADLKKDCDGLTPLQTAVVQQNRETVKQLLEQGADANSKTEDGSNCLHLAAEGNDMEIVKLVLEKTNMNAKDKAKRTPLMNAVLANKYDNVQFLIHKGAKINVLDCDKMSTLYHAVRHKDGKMAKLLLNHGADPNSRERESGNTPFSESFRLNDMELMNLMIERGADVFYLDDMGYSSLHAAAIYGSSKMIQRLIDMGLDITARTMYNETFLHEIFEGTEREVDEMLSFVKLALDKGVDINARDDLLGASALLRCVRWKNTKILKHILSLKDVDVNVKDRFEGGRNALEFAINGCNPAALKCLLNDERVKLKRKDHESLLMKASDYYEYESERPTCLEMIKMLMEHGVTLKDHQNFNVKTFERIRFYEEKFKEDRIANLKSDESSDDEESVENVPRSRLLDVVNAAGNKNCGIP